MIPGPYIVIACSNCQALSTFRSLKTGNTFGAVRWTDGKLDAPMLPSRPMVTKCHVCGTIYWVDDARRVGEYEFSKPDQSNVDPAWEEAPKVRDLTEDECYQAIDSGLGSTIEKERLLRLITWWRSNDRFRDSSAPVVQSLDDRRIENMRRLFDLLDTDRVNDRITRAELARELGDFAGAVHLLATIDDKRVGHIKSFLLALCHENITTVKQIPEEEDG